LGERYERSFRRKAAVTLRTILLAATLFGLAHTAGAARVLEQVERAVELRLSQLTLPGGTDGTLSFRTCADCRVGSHRVSATTKYLLDGSEVPLEDFRRAIEEIRKSRAANESTIAAVFLDLATERVTRVSVRRFAP